MRAKAGITLMALGALLLAAALGLFLYNRAESDQATQAAEAALPQVMAAATEPADPETLRQTEMPVYEFDDLDYVAVLEIPALELTLPVLDAWSYPNLKKAPCRYTGSARTGDLVIAAHNYDRHFGRLTKLRAGDAVTLTDMDGVRYIYEVAEVEVLAPTDVEEMTNSGYPLTLFTCTYGGKSRVTVRCDLLDCVLSDTET
jgi:sortase A